VQASSSGNYIAEEAFKNSFMQQSLIEHPVYLNRYGNLKIWIKGKYSEMIHRLSFDLFKN